MPYGKRISYCLVDNEIFCEYKQSIKIVTSGIDSFYVSAMASVVGKWKIEKSDNFDEYLKAIGVSDEKRTEAHKYLSDGSGMTQEFKADGDNWTQTTTTAVGERTIEFTIGKEIDSFTLDGRPIKVVFTIDGDSLIEKQTGDGFECTHVRKGEVNTLTMTLTGNGQACVRKFSRV